MPQFNGPIGKDGVFRRRTCSYLNDKKGLDEDLRCLHPINRNRYCCLSFCPIVTDEKKEKENETRNILKHTAPKLDNPKISFPDHHEMGRIRFPSGSRLIDWEGDQWRAYLKEGAQWDARELNDDDYELLYDCLRDQIRAALPI